MSEVIVPFSTPVTAQVQGAAEIAMEQLQDRLLALETEKNVELERVIAEKDNAIAATIAEKDNVIAEKDHTIAATIAEKDNVIAEKDHTIAATIAEKEHALAEAIAQKEAEKEAAVARAVQEAVEREKIAALYVTFCFHFFTLII